MISVISSSQRSLRSAEQTCDLTDPMSLMSYDDDYYDDGSVFVRMISN